MDIREKIAYLQGLANGLGVEEKGPQGEVITGILDVLEDIADHLEGVDEDLGEIAEEVFAAPAETADWEVTCPACGGAFAVTTGELEDDEVDLVCPNCGHVIHDFNDDLEADEPDAEVTDRT